MNPFVPISEHNPQPGPFRTDDEKIDWIVRLLQPSSSFPSRGQISKAANFRSDSDKSMSPVGSGSLPYVDGPSVQPRLVTTDLPFPTPRNDDERIENAVWLIENNPSGRAPTSPIDDPDIQPEPTTPLNSNEASNPDLGPHFYDTKLLDRVNSSFDSKQNSPFPFGFSNLFGLIGTADAQQRTRGRSFDRTPIEAARAQWYGLLHRRLEQMEPRNPYLSTISPPNYIPTPENIQDLAREVREAEARIAAGLPPRPPGNLGPLPTRRGGETESTIAGRAGHGERLNSLEEEGYVGEHRMLEGALRADAVRLNARDSDLVEIKSNARRAVQRGERQLQRYKKALEEETKMPVNSRIETYDIQEMIKRILGLLE